MALSAGCYLVIDGLSGATTPQWLLLAGLSTFFLAVIVRLVVAAAVSPRRKIPRLVMLGGVVLWAVGSASLNTGGELTSIAFPSVAEVFFIPAYALFVAFLLVDQPRAGAGDPSAVSLSLESAIVVSGGACLLAFVLFTPLAGYFGASGLPLVLALFYPMLDIVLASLVVSQIALHRRPWSRRSASLVGGFVALLMADMLLVISLADLRYASNTFTELLYGIGFALIVGAACTRSRAPTRTASAGNGLVVAVAAAVAMVVLVARPASSGLWYVTAPAVITLVAAGVRLVLALREARNATEARRLSLTDDLTGLPNRRAVLADIQEGLGRDEPLGLLLFDLDGFKEVNDSLGHSAGDAVLREVADRLPECVPASSLVARLGGDEFAVVLRRDDPGILLALADTARRSLMAPVTVDGLNLTVNASVGVTARRRDDTRAADLLRRADVAMYEAKASRAGALVYDTARDLYTRERLQLAEQLRNGIAAGQLTMFYQPQVDTHSRQVTGVEALVRWRHPEMGIISPIEFLPVARRSGLMAALTEVVVTDVVADARRWFDAGLDLRVSFNCAPPELLGTTFLPQLFEVLKSANLPPNTLLVEVTEDSLVGDPELARRILQRLRDHDVQTAIDDYGTGFSSLAYLRDLPVHELKIDRTFVSTILGDPFSRVIVDSTRQMAHAMGLRLVAEGVEDLATVEELAILDVDVLQGYHISPPMPATDVVAWLAKWKIDNASVDLDASRGAA